MAQGKDSDLQTDSAAPTDKPRPPAASLHLVSPRLVRTAAEIAGTATAPKKPPRRRNPKSPTQLPKGPRPPKSKRPPLTAATFAGTARELLLSKAPGLLPTDAAVATGELARPVAEPTPEQAREPMSPPRAAAPQSAPAPAQVPAEPSCVQLAETKPHLSVVVPCFNEADNLAELYRRITAACRATLEEPHELVLVNDGSTDASWQNMCDLAAKDDAVVAVNLSRNHGQQLALSAGLQIARGDRVLVLDAGLQDPPELLGEMLARVDEGVDVAFGLASPDNGDGWLSRTIGRVTDRLLNRIVEFDVPGSASNFCLLTRRALEVLNRMPEQHRHLRSMIGWTGLKQAPVPYHRVPRFAGDRRPRMRRRLRLAMDAITGFSTGPLRLATWLGIGFAVTGLGLLVYMLIAMPLATGWLGAISAVLLVGGVQLIILGVVGAYVGRLYLEAKGRPLYVIEDIVRAQQTNEAAAGNHG